MIFSMVCCPVKRWSTCFLLLLTVLLPLQPLFASAQADAGLPACCRRNGAHHCVMSQMQAFTSTDTQPFLSPSPCPYWKTPVLPAVVATVGSSLALLLHSPVVGDVVVAAPAFFFARLARLFSTRAPPTDLLPIPVSQA